MFVDIPFTMGFVSVMIYSYREPRSLPTCLGVACLSPMLLGLALLAYAIEGLICLVMAAPLALLIAAMGGALEVPLYRLFDDGEAPPKLENLPKRKTADEIAWGSSGKDVHFLSNLRRLFGRAEERDRKLLLSFAQKLASKRNGRNSIVA
jgi:hypothetical protein